MNSNHIISSTSSLLEALDKLNELPGGSMTLFVTDTDGKLLGSLTDGDIRRALIAGATLSDPVTKAAHINVRTISVGTTDVETLRNFRLSGITLIPEIDNAGCLRNIIDLRQRKNILPLRAILMAGGKGERLRPATLTTPKPLLKIEDKAIIDYNIEALAQVGISDISVATRYLAEQIENHFSTPVAGVKVKCIREEAPLGTIGAVGLLSHPANGSTLVMNSDLLTTISFEDMYLRHCQQNADITIAVIPYSLSVPYAILSFDPANSESVVAIEEKPAYSYYANAGIYIFNNSIFNLLTAGEHCDATDLIERAIAHKHRVTYFPIQGTWIDVGSPTDFRQAGELIRHHNNMSNRS